MAGERVLHVYGPEVSGGEVWIRGSGPALVWLAQALQEATILGHAVHTFTTADGQEFEVRVMMDNTPADSPSWQRSELPYTVERDGRPDAIGPWIEQGLDGRHREGSGASGN